MNEFFHYGLRSYWRSRPEAPSALGARFIDTLDALSRIDPVLFANWQLTDFQAMAQVPLEEARMRMASLVESNVSQGSDRSPDPESGYCPIARAGEFRHPASVMFKADAGGKYTNETVLQLAEYEVAPDLAVVRYPLFRAALLVINANWQPAWACAYAFRLGYNQKPLHPGAALFPYSIFHIPWIGYLSPPLAAGLQVAPELSSERTPDGGILITATDERLDPANPEHLRDARVIAEIMMACTGEKPTSLEEQGRAQKIADEIGERARRYYESGGGSGP